jgi:hypothetical protein
LQKKEKESLVWEAMANLVNTTVKKYLEKVLEKQKKSLCQQAIRLLQFSRL